MEKVETTYDKSHITQRGIKIGNYILRKKLGAGQFGTVFKAKDYKTGKEYAIKRMRKSAIDQNEILKRLLQSEAAIMNHINHNNILHLYDFLESKNNYYLVVNYCNQGDFEAYLEENKTKFLSEEKAVYFLKHIMNGFQELRKHKVLHRDFKLANLFVHDEKVVIGDFGFAKSGENMAKTKLGTPLTMAYEILISNNDEDCYYNSKADLWSIGVVYYQMLFGNYPFNGYTMREIIKDIKKKVNNLDFPRHVSEESKNLINRLLECDPEKRISWPEFFNHPLFTKFVIKSTIVGNKKNHMSVIGSNIKCDKEFLNNKKNIKDKNIQFMDQDKILELFEKKKIEKKNVEETKCNDSLEKELIFRNISYRYNHEKNKILFIILSAKKILKSLKKNLCKFAEKDLYNVSLLLIKKAIVLNNCNMKKLKEKKNIYYFNKTFFEELTKQKKHLEILKIFEQDYNKFENLLKLVIKKLEEKKIQNIVNKYIEVKNPNLMDLDKSLNKFYSHLKNFKNFEMDDNERKILYFNFASIRFCIYSEMVFPYLPNPRNKNRKFNWAEFYDNHENADINQLAEII